MALKGVTVNGTDHHFDYAYLENKPFKKGTLTIRASEWSASDPHVANKSVSGFTENSKVDLQPDATVLTRLMTDGVKALWAENDGGHWLRVKALGAAPTQDIEIQYTMTEL
jgi:hypothetical protein